MPQAKVCPGSTMRCIFKAGSVFDLGSGVVLRVVNVGGMHAVLMYEVRSSVGSSTKSKDRISDRNLSGHQSQEKLSLNRQLWK